MFNLFIPWYNDDSSFRQQELDWCLQHNDINPMIENIFLFPELRTDKLPKVTAKVKTIHLNRRVTYGDIINTINSIVESHNNFNIIANTDIYFDESLNLINQINMGNVCLALTRWESHPDNKGSKPYQYMTEQSQDVWIFKSYINMNVECNFYLGLAGCEGRFNFELQKVGYRLYNPANDIRALHYHVSGKRNWSEDTRLQGDSINPPIINIKDMKNGY